MAVQDLQRWLRKDDENRVVHLQLGKWQLVGTHLIPLLIEYGRSDGNQQGEEDNDLIFETSTQKPIAAHKLN